MIDSQQKNLIVKISRNSKPGDPPVSVIVVSFHSGKNILTCMSSLATQSFPNFEIVLVDNGGNDSVLDRILEYPITLVQMKQNVGCSMGKNIGADVGRGEIVCFLDDDAIAAPDFVQAHYNSYTDRKVSAVRGKVLPRDPENIYNQFAYHYNLGDEVVPALIDTETNASFRKEIFTRCGGFKSPIIRGDGEGLELSYRIAKAVNEPTALIYNPNAVVYHDYAHQLSKFFKKAIVQPKAMAILRNQYPDMEAFIKSYPDSCVVADEPKPFGYRAKRYLLRHANDALRWASRKWYLRKTSG